MKIAICGSLDFTHEIKKIADELKKLGFEVYNPISVERILAGKFSLDEIKQEKENGKFSERIIKYNSIKAYWKVIDKADVILVANFDKKDVRNYIGGAVFLEMGHAFHLNKKIFLLNKIPEMHYADEIKAMQPVVLNGNLTKIKKP